MAVDRETINALMRRVLRQTESEGENDLDAAIAVFETLVDGAYTATTAGSGQVISTSGNGKTVTVTLSSSLSQLDILKAADTAIAYLSRGATYIPNRSIGRF
jgi:hypothetical protein